MSVSAADSDAVFKARMKECHLGSYVEKFAELGWLSYSAFAFATTALDKPDTATFNKEVLEQLFGEATHALAPKVRKLFLESWAIATEDMKTATRPTDAPRPPMHREDRRLGTKRVKDKVSEVFEMVGEDAPSTSLIDVCYDILQHEAVVHVRWELCTSARQELRNPKLREDPGLILDGEGVFRKHKPDGPRADLSEDLRWADAMQRRGCALDIAGLLDFTIHQKWVKIMRIARNEPPHAGYRRVSWEQLLDADVALFDFIEINCPDGPRTKPGEQVSDFQKQFVRGMTDRKVERHLEQRQGNSSQDSGSASAASALAPVHSPGGGGRDRASGGGGGGGDAAEIARLNRKLENKEKENANLKRKLGSDGPGGGRDRGGRARNRAPTGAPPGPKTKSKAIPEKRLRREKSDQGSRICFAFNSEAGCTKCGPGQACNFGLHICLLCGPDVAHSCASMACPKRSLWL